MFTEKQEYTFSRDVRLNSYEIKDIRELFDTAGLIITVKWFRKVHSVSIEQAMLVIKDICK